MSKATAIAHPIQGLIKYHGLRDMDWRIPFHDSISVCTAPFETCTTVELRLDLKDDIFEIDGVEATGRAYERAEAVIKYIRQTTSREDRVFVRSKNNFPSNIGLGASASGFAALAVAASSAFEAGLTKRQLTTVARIGAGSASRAVAGSYAHWYAGSDHDSSYAETIATEENLPLSMVIAIIPAFKQTEDAHREAMLSHLMPCRIAYAKSVVDDMQVALLDGKFSTVGWLAELDTLSLHATTMTGPTGFIHWQPETLMVFQAVRKMREEGLECYFSADTGATVYINTRPENRDAVRERIAALGVQTEVAEVGGAARLVNEHLF